VVEIARDVAASKPIVLRTHGEFNLQRGDRVRVLDALIAVVRDDEAQPAVATVGALSEVFAAPARSG